MRLLCASATEKDDATNLGRSRIISVRRPRQGFVAVAADRVILRHAKRKRHHPKAADIRAGTAKPTSNTAATIVKEGEEEVRKAEEKV